MPDWIGWITLGAVGIPTAELPFVYEGNLHEDGNTGSSESGFDNQLLFTDVDGSFNLSVIPHDSTRNVGVGPH